jgi:pimeloyl-ACP methyl ester carboxylesterase
MDHIQHDSRETAYRIVKPDADEPKILYVHGSGGNHRIWGNQYGPAGPVNPAVAVDLSGHGESTDVETEPGQATLAAYATDVAAVARNVDADVLVGHSLGGAVLFELVLEEYYEPAGVVFAGTGAKLAIHEGIRTLLQDDFEAFLDTIHAESRLFADPDDSDLETSKATFRETGQTVTRRDLLTCHTFDVRDRLPEVEVPALAVVGEHDGLAPPAYHEYLGDELPNCEVETIPDAAHMAMIEQPRRFNDFVQQFCDRLQTG